MLTGHLYNFHWDIILKIQFFDHFKFWLSVIKLEDLYVSYINSLLEI